MACGEEWAEEEAHRQAGRTVPGVGENPEGLWGHSRGIKGKSRIWDKNGNSDLF